MQKVAASADNRLTQDSRNAINRSRTGKSPFFFSFFVLIYSSRFLDGFERLSAEAIFLTPAHTAKMYLCSQGTLDLTP